MFSHIKDLQYNAKPSQPDPVYAKKLQEILGGQFGEISVMMQYLFQGWNCRGNSKYRDMLLDIGTEEIAHVEMIATMIAQLLEGAPAHDQDQAAQDPVVEAVLGGMNPQHAVVNGLGAQPNDSAGYPWNARYTIASGNLLADFRANLNAESQGRLQAVRLYEMTTDPGVRDMLSFLIARDKMHQNQWMAAIEELEQMEGAVVPNTFSPDHERQDVAYTFMNFSEGEESSQGRWAQGSSMDGKGTFSYVQNPDAVGQKPELAPAPAFIHGTLPFTPSKDDDPQL
ncbi:manganese catalase family protein [Halobacillus karajensis]|uniref:Manganese catalase n=1 Tax=Halobacillus karajensis TaxID=195088 RepID=A0A024P580_9BACI|nr:manganese catalase family protein [Halobacillus karajensis]CDQ20588.1 putative manganese catalase [Halobacillus karajensis]CDQ23943.1 putative manganese catalase [Halobacillus karajensis]CDQ27421.1 putative manganese catalase [Halobacillus karajensis]